MRFYIPGPKSTAPGCERAKDPSTRQSMSRRGTSACRVVLGANKNAAIAIFAKPNGNYSGGVGNQVTVTFYNAGGGRAAMQFFFGGSKIDGNVVSFSGLAGIPAALAAKADLTPHFFVRLGDLTDQVWDPGAGEGNGSLMIGGY